MSIIRVTDSGGAPPIFSFCCRPSSTVATAATKSVPRLESSLHLHQITCIHDGDSKGNGLARAAVSIQADDEAVGVKYRSAAVAFPARHCQLVGVPHRSSDCDVAHWLHRKTDV